MILTENKTGKRFKKSVFLCAFLIAFIYFFNNMASATAIPNVSLNINTGGNSTNMSDSIELLLFFTLLSVLPSILIMMTCFTRIVVILSFLTGYRGSTDHTVTSYGGFSTVFDIFYHGSCGKTSL